MKAVRYIGGSLYPVFDIAEFHCNNVARGNGKCLPLFLLIELYVRGFDARSMYSPITFFTFLLVDYFQPSKRIFVVE